MYNQQNQNPAQGQKNGSTNTNTPNVPEARAALDNMKFEIASELGINLKQGYNGDLPSTPGWLHWRLYGKAHDRAAGTPDERQVIARSLVKIKRPPMAVFFCIRQNPQ